MADNNQKIAEYKEDDIIVLEGLEGVRARPQMYVGDLHNAQFHILKEILDNAVDECLAGGNKLVGCIITPDYYEVFDEGRGIPVGINPNSKEKKSTLELVFTKLHAGGKLKMEPIQQVRVAHTESEALAQMHFLLIFRFGPTVIKMVDSILFKRKTYFKSN